MKIAVLLYIVTVALSMCQCISEFGNNVTKKLQTHCGLQENAVSLTDFPWVAFIPMLTRTFNPDANVRCMGALINEQFVITSSTCLQFVITHVKIGRFEIPVDRWTTHDSLDIALLYLEKNVEFSDLHQPICLPFKQFEVIDKKTTLYTTGWGASQGELKVVKNRMVECTDRDTMCLNHVGKNTVCSGDEGSPVMSMTDNKWILHGILSSTFDKDGSPCATKNPSRAIIITDDVLNWITKIIGV